MKKVVWFILFLLLAVSCLDEPDCYRLNNNFVGITFHKMFNGQADTVAIIQISAADNVFYDHIYSTGVSLPLNYLTDTTAFYIETSDGIYFLNLSYKAKPQFVSEDCGERFVLSELGIRKTINVDSVRLISTTLSNPAQANIAIYRCPRNNIIKLSFRQLYMDTVKRGKLDTRAITSITNDFLGINYESTSLNTVHLPLNTALTSTEYIFNFADGSTNTVSVKYEIGLKTIFDQCGQSKLPFNLDTTSQDFQVLHITNDSIHDAPVTNIETFRCPVTNLIKAAFKKPNGNTETDTLKSVTADYLGTDTLYRNVIVNNLTLPLNPNPALDTTTFTFEFNGGIKKKLQLGYTATTKVFHEGCGAQTVFTVLKMNSTEFTEIKIKEPTVKFPAANNIEIIK